MRENCRRASRKEEQKGWKTCESMEARNRKDKCYVTSSGPRSCPGVFERIYLFIERIEELEGSTLKAQSKIERHVRVFVGRLTKYTLH